MKLAVVAYPALSDRDREWIEGIRARSDPQATRIAAHLTLVFPADVAGVLLVARVETAIRSSAAVALVLRGTAVLPDGVGGGAVVLLAEEGRAELRALHDALYEGALAAHRRSDVPYLPHLTVGAHPELEGAERMAGQLDREGRVVRGRISSVDVIEVSEPAVRTVARMSLPMGGARR